MDNSLVDLFEQELSDLIDKYSNMELTKAEAIGVLEFAKNNILNGDDEDET